MMHLITLDPILRIFFEILHNGRYQEVHENSINGSPKKYRFFLFITVKGPKRYMELKINGFIQKNTWLV